MRRRVVLGLLMTAVLIPSGVFAQSPPDFSGNWKQSNERSTPRRTGNVTLHIDHREPELFVETTILRSASVARHAIQRYTTDGREYPSRPAPTEMSFIRPLSGRDGAWFSPSKSTRMGASLFRRKHGPSLRMAPRWRESASHSTRHRTEQESRLSSISGKGRNPEEQVG